MGHAVHQQCDANRRRRGAVPGQVQQLAGGDPADGLPAGDQHPAYQPAHCHVQVGSHESGALTSPHRITYSDRHVRRLYPSPSLSAATPSLRCKPTATSTGSSSATTWSCSTTLGRRWLRLSSSCPTLIFSSRGTSAKFPQSRSTTLVSRQPESLTWLLFILHWSIMTLNILLLVTSSLSSALLCSLPVLHLKGKAANRLTTWETIQKEDFLTAQNKIQKSSDSERLKRMSAKWARPLSGALRQIPVCLDKNVRRCLSPLFFVQGGWRSQTAGRKPRLWPQVEGFGERGRITVSQTSRYQIVYNCGLWLDQMEYCSSALSWIVDTLAQNSTFKPPRPPPTFRGAHDCTCHRIFWWISVTVWVHSPKLVPQNDLNKNSVSHLFFTSDNFPSSSMPL